EAQRPTNREMSAHTARGSHRHTAATAFTRPRQGVGGAGDDPIAAATLRHSGEGFIERGRRQLFVAGEHRCSDLFSVMAGLVPAIPLRKATPSRSGSLAPAGDDDKSCHSAASFCAVSILAFTTTLIASSTRSLA